jgi:protein-disulfide isomerase
MPHAFRHRSAFALLLPLLAWGCGGDAPEAVPPGGDDDDAAPSTQPSPAGRGDTIHLYELGHHRGDPDAPIIVFEFSEFGCPFSASFATETYPVIEREFIETGQVQWIYLPIVVGGFANAELAARTAECAAEQGAFGRAQARIFEGQQEWRQTGSLQAPAYFTRLAAAIGVEAEPFASCVATARVAERLARNVQAARALDVNATPTFVIDGRKLEGALPVDQFRALLERVISERAERDAQGAGGVD